MKRREFLISALALPVLAKTITASDLEAKRQEFFFKP